MFLKVSRFGRLLSFCSLLALTPACSVHKLTGEVMSEYTNQHLRPYLLSRQDLDMACELGVSMGSFILSFEQFWPELEDSNRRPVELASIPTLATAALCAEEEATEAALSSLRALRFAGGSEGDLRLAFSQSAQDARIVQKRAHARAALRYYEAFQRSERLFKTSCPEDEGEELGLLFGLIAG